MNLEETSHNDFHKVFETNPMELKNMVNKVVKVHYGSDVIEGTVYTIDPVSQAVALMVRHEDTGIVDMHLIFERHIKSMEVIGESKFPVEQDLFDNRSGASELSSQEKTDRCEKLMKWLQANMIPIVKEGELLKLSDVLTIHSPYEPDNCMSKNVIVLEKIQNLIKAMNEGSL